MFSIYIMAGRCYCHCILSRVQGAAAKALEWIERLIRAEGPRRAAEQILQVIHSCAEGPLILMRPLTLIMGPLTLIMGPLTLIMRPLTLMGPLMV